MNAEIQELDFSYPRHLIWWLGVKPCYKTGNYFYFYFTTDIKLHLIVSDSNFDPLAEI